MTIFYVFHITCSLDIADFWIFFSPKPYSDQEFSGWYSPSTPLPASEKSPSEQQQQQMVFSPHISSSNFSQSWKSDSLKIHPP